MQYLVAETLDACVMVEAYKQCAQVAMDVPSCNHFTRTRRGVGGHSPPEKEKDTYTIHTGTFRKMIQSIRRN
jgi:hypothetical protein